MRLIVTIILSLGVFIATSAQDNKTLRSSVEPIPAEQQSVDDDSQYLNGMIPVGSFKKELPEADSLHLPPLDSDGRVMSYNSWRYPYMGGFWGWDIHEGLNVNLGVSAFTSFGKNSFSGWGQNIATVYAKPINDKLSVAIGGYLNNYSTGRGAFRSAGITGVLNYRFNEHWEAFVYGQKAFYDNSMQLFDMYSPYSPYGWGCSSLYNMGLLGDRIGAGVRWIPNESTSISVQFEVSSTPDRFHDRVLNRWQMPEQK